uniref:Uncharacterized protein n=1 Tax=Myotis myotis TaxID=51298 RepID=A0A7J7R055_MYOMY|nr:hypothetical protein mMyoMyo1_011242 [Myotis myotis]
MEAGPRGWAAAPLSLGEASLAWSTSSDGAKEHSGPKEISLAREQDIEKGLDKRVRGEGSSNRPRFLPWRREIGNAGISLGETESCVHVMTGHLLSPGECWGSRSVSKPGLSFLNTDQRGPFICQPPLAPLP